MNLRLMKIYSEQYCTKSLLILLTITILIILHFVVHKFENNGSVSENQSRILEAEKNYQVPLAEKVTILAEPDWPKIETKINEKQKSSLCFVILVDRTDGFSYRNETYYNLNSSTNCVIFVQVCNVIDRKEDKTTIFIQSANFFNPWATIMQNLYSKIKEFAKLHEFLIIISSKTAINYDKFEKFEKFLLEQHQNNRILTAKRRAFEVDRRPEKQEFVPKFLFKSDFYHDNSPSDEIIVFPLRVWNSLEDNLIKSDKRYLPLGVFVHDLIENSKRAEIESSKPVYIDNDLVSINSKVGSNLCKFKTPFIITGYESREQINDIISNEPEFGYICIPVINYHVNIVTIFVCAFIVCGCFCLQCSLVFFLTLAAPRRTQKKK